MEDTIKNKAHELATPFRNSEDISEKSPKFSNVTEGQEYLIRLGRTNQWLITLLFSKIENLRSNLRKIEEKVDSLKNCRENNQELEELTRKFSQLKTSDDLGNKIDSLEKEIKNAKISKPQPEFGWSREKVDLSWLHKP